MPTATATAKPTCFDLARIMEKRKLLPFCEGDAVSGILNLNRFDLVSSVWDYEKVLVDALNADSIDKVFNKVAEIFEVDKREVCLVHKRKLASGVEKLMFRYKFNQFMNDLLKKTGEAVFDKGRSAWSVPIKESYLEIISGGLHELFAVVIEIDSMRFSISTRNESSIKTCSAFVGAPFSIALYPNEIIDCLKSDSRVRFNESSKVYVHNGEKFVPFTYVENDPLYTRLPFLIFRVSTDAQPRYVSFSSLAKAVESIGYGREKQVGKMIARYMDALYVLKLPVFDAKAIEVNAVDLSERVSRFRGGFDLVGFNEVGSENKLLERVFADIKVSVLVSDYVSLVDAGYGADVDDVNGGLIAYVVTNPKHASYLRNVSRFFEYSGDEYPIIFNGSFLADFKDEKDEYLKVVLHEVAHYLCAECDAIDYRYKAHGVEWGVYLLLLNYIYFGSTEENYISYGRDVSLISSEKIYEKEMELLCKRVDGILLNDKNHVFMKSEIHELARDSILRMKGRIEYVDDIE